MNILKFNESDIDNLLLHSRSVGWYHRGDWEFFIQNGIVLGHKHENRIVSSAFVTNYERKIGWLGAFIINPEYQGQGLGKELLKSCLGLDFIDDNFRLGLVSTERGKFLYESMGFQTIATTYKFIKQSKSIINCNDYQSKFSVQDLEETHVKVVLQLDCHSFGADRSYLLTSRLKESLKNIILADKDGKIVGFASGVLEGDMLIIGPLYAPNPKEAMILICTLSKLWDGPFRIDVPHWQKELIEILSSIAEINLDRVCPVMSLKGHHLHQSPFYYGIISQALG